MACIRQSLFLVCHCKPSFPGICFSVSRTPRVVRTCLGSIDSEDVPRILKFCLQEEMLTKKSYRYGRAFANTDGPGNPFSGTGEGSWEQGVWDFKALPKDGAMECMDEDVGASWSYDEGRRVMVSYDTKEISKRKVDFIKNRGLGGAMWWESSADRQGNESLISTVCVIFISRFPGTLLKRTRLFMGCIVWIEATIHSNIQTLCTTILGMGFPTSNR